MTAKENKTQKEKTIPKARARRVLFADEVQTRQQTNGYSTQSLPRNWGKSAGSPQPQVRRKNGYFYLESPSPTRKETRSVNQPLYQQKGPDSRMRYNSLPNMKNGYSIPVLDPPRQKNAFYNVDETKVQEEKEKLRSASVHLYASLNNRIHQQRRPVERSSSLNQPKTRMPLVSAMKKPSNSTSNVPRGSPQDTNRWHSLETLHEANEGEESPKEALIYPIHLVANAQKETLIADNEKPTVKVRRSSSLNTHRPRSITPTISEKDRSIERLIKRFQRKILEADKITAKADTESLKPESPKVPDLRIIPATPEDGDESTINSSTAVLDTEDKSLPEAEPKTETLRNHTSSNGESKTVTPDPRAASLQETENAQPKSAQAPEPKQTSTKTLKKTAESENTAVAEPSNTEHPAMTCRPHSTCCCCHHHHHEHHQPPAGFSREGNYLHMLQYIHTPTEPNLNR